MIRRNKELILGKLSHSSQFKINFVCSGNIIRSPYAQLLFTYIIKNSELENRITVESSGVKYRNCQISCESYQMLLTEGIPEEKILKFTPRFFIDYPHIYEDVDLILVMEKNHIKYIPEQFREKAFLLLEFTQGDAIDVPDPYFDPPYERVFSMIKQSLLILKDQMLKSIQ